MAQVNSKNKEVQLKVVYYGPGRGGKTTSLEYIQKRLSRQSDVRMVKLKSNEERTLFFDFYPIKIGKMKGYDIRVQLYTVPGQNRLQPLRRLVLKGADSIVFVADAMSLRRYHNIEAFKNLVENLGFYNKALSRMPFVIQLNKIDLAEEAIPLISMPMLKADLSGCINDGGFIERAPCYETSAASGKNVLKTLDSIIRLTVTQLDFAAIAGIG